MRSKGSMETSFQLPQVVGVLAALLLIAAATLAFTKRIDQPFSVGLVFVGVALGVFLDYGPESLAPFNQYGVSQEVILFVFLPTLLFESAFNLDVRQVRHNLLPVLTVPNEMDIRYAVRRVCGTLWPVLRAASIGSTPMPKLSQ
jgi:CPA1 family monovalent cation:H+ antiporter